MNLLPGSKFAPLSDGSVHEYTILRRMGTSPWYPLVTLPKCSLFPKGKSLLPSWRSKFFQLRIDCEKGGKRVAELLPTKMDQATTDLQRDLTCYDHVLMLSEI